MSLARQLFHDECEAGINEQIGKELEAMHAYMAMSAFFYRDDVALPNIAGFFKRSAAEEKEHAEKLMQYQNKRGGRVVFKDIAAPTKTEFASALEAFKTALQMEKDINESLLSLHALSDKHNDYQMSDFIEGEYLKEQVEASNQLAAYVTQLQRVGEGVGVYQFDSDLQS